MADERTLRLAYRPITEELLARFLHFTRLELDGVAATQALAAAGIEAEDVARITAAVSAFCRPRLLRRRLAAAAPANPEAEQRRQEALALPIDDAEFLALHPEQTHRVLLAHEQQLVELRERRPGQGPWRS